jgi:molybdenum cofactor biosynthesis protein B
MAGNSSSKIEFVSLNIAVMTVSDSRTEANDTAGKLFVERLTRAAEYKSRAN